MNVIKPVGPNLLIKIIKQPVASGILLPDGVKTSENEKALVVMTGTKCELGISVGDEVQFKANTMGVSVGEDLHIIPENCIAGILNYVEKE